MPVACRNRRGSPAGERIRLFDDWSSPVDCCPIPAGRDRLLNLLLREQMQIESVLPSCILTTTAVAFPQKSESVLSHLRKRLISAIIKKR